MDLLRRLRVLWSSSPVDSCHLGHDGLLDFVKKHDRGLAHDLSSANVRFVNIHDLFLDVLKHTLVGHRDLLSITLLVVLELLSVRRVVKKLALSLLLGKSQTIIGLSDPVLKIDLDCVLRIKLRLQDVPLLLLFLLKQLELELSLLQLADAEKVLFLKLVEDVVELRGVLEKKLISIVVIRDINQMQIHELIETALPLGFSDAGTLVFLTLVPALLRGETGLSVVLLFHEGEVSFHTSMDLLVILEDDVIEGLVLLDFLDPVTSELVKLCLNLDLSLFLVLLWHETKHESLVFIKVTETLFVLGNVVLSLLDLCVKLLELLFLLLALLLLILKGLLSLLSAAVIARDEEHEVGSVLFELLL